jgi:hypothetical protein
MSDLDSDRILEEIWKGTMCPSQSSHFATVQKSFLDRISGSIQGTNLDEELQPRISDINQVKAIKKYFLWTQVEKKELQSALEIPD